ncbi:hypothetical protein LOK49_LG08G00003 [Camellia lanceoleosa]|uniref:Uncharacterized protein n=1 Tax=Camellia lanceoleosa TaxID=1840588 RepID=A0ACC0GNV6_9ERIC|nr:hypothetical protein LOK49_LG08G00003 [Camellia lanceoleosa]
MYEMSDWQLVIIVLEWGVAGMCAAAPKDSGKVLKMDGEGNAVDYDPQTITEIGIYKHILIEQLDKPGIIRLARTLPTGDVSALRADAAKEQEEALDEDDLT